MRAVLLRRDGRKTSEQIAGEDEQRVAHKGDLGGHERQVGEGHQEGEEGEARDRVDDAEESGDEGHDPGPVTNEDYGDAADDQAPDDRHQCQGEMFEELGHDER